MPTPKQPTIDSIPPEYRHLFEGAQVKRPAQALGYIPQGYRPDPNAPGLLGNQNQLAAAGLLQQPEHQNALARVMSGPLGMAPEAVMAGAKGAGQGLLSKATALEKQGVPPAAIWQTTGWGRGPDGSWHFHAGDKSASIHIEPPQR